MSYSNFIQAFDKVKVTGEFTVLDNGCNSGYNYFEISSDLDNQDRLTEYQNRSRFRIPKGNVQKIDNYELTPEESELLLASKQLPTKAIIVDIDGTIAQMKDRKPFDYSKVVSDQPDLEIIKLIHIMSSWYTVLFVSGREDSCFNQTAYWLSLHIPNWDHFIDPGLSLFMRKSEDYRSDTIIKREIFFEHIVKKYNVEYAFDDRDKVVKLWRSLGIKCLQVAEGDF